LVEPPMRLATPLQQIAQQLTPGIRLRNDHERHRRTHEERASLDRWFSPGSSRMKFWLSPVAVNSLEIHTPPEKDAEW
jgi:hypothetical protein